MLSGDVLARYPRVIVELGMGDGRLLEALAKTDKESLYLGIEIDSEQCAQARSRISAENVLIAHGSFEEIIPSIPDDSVDLFISILPDPAFIDEARSEAWRNFYAQVRSKLKAGGRLQLVTELTDELLEPVTDDSLRRWAGWLETTFTSLGFVMTSVADGAPTEYSSRCLDQFRGDTERIRMVTMNFAKA